ncbi:glycosyltransferase family 39 protein [Spirosoma validum]|uniref:Glycosyltransferase family 39 protein n=1 Tax=Spirosoma validum TaxID=2771355 RepID=A0A927B6J2_9BACT|nr:glycosyltransferase family 39 protein [Spirosoma validum]MBD2756634.1 glycosyltransferase family 39 protein [Spirosoma validum]
MFTPLSRTTLFLLSALLVLALCLRLYRVGTYSIYFDEKSTLLISQSVVLEGSNQRDVFSKPYFTPAEFWKPKTFTDFVEASIRGDIGNSPAYYAVVWLWLKLFGLSDTSLRMPSVIFSVLIVWLLFVFVRRHFQTGSRLTGSAGFPALSNRSVDTLALTSAAIATIEPFFVSYSHIARNYSMTFFLTLLATHLFLLIQERVRSQDSIRSPAASGAVSLPVLYVAYGFVFVTAVLSHYLAITVFLCHGLYALLYLRNSRAWITLGITSVVGLGLVSLWFFFGGGKYTFFTLEQQKNFYRHIALTNPTGSGYGLILPATFPNISIRAIPIFSDLFIITNGLGNQLTGLRNSIPALGLSVLATGLLHRYFTVPKPPVWVYVAFPLILLAGLPVYTVTPLRLLVLSVSIPFIYLIVRFIIDNINSDQKRIVILLLFLTFIPTFFLLFMAWRSGHTFGITQRYSGFSFPYVCILVAMGLLQLPKLHWWFSLPIATLLVLQGVHIGQLLGEIYADESPKYTYFGKARIANPYWASAQRLKELYAPGDTILYPNKKRIIYSEKIDKTYSPVTLIDAQMVNVYLPKDAQYIQRVDPNERDRIVLVKGNSDKKITIFDFQGGMYRYGDSE